MIKLLLSSKSAKNSVTIQTPDTVDPKNPLKEIQRESKDANKNLVNNDLINMPLETRKSGLTETSNRADKFHVRNYLFS